MGYLNTKVYEEGINKSFLEDVANQNKRLVIFLTSTEMTEINAGSILASSALIKLNDNNTTPSLEDGELIGVFSYDGTAKKLTINNIGYEYTKDTLTAAGENTETQYRTEEGTATHFAVVCFDEVSGEDTVDISPYTEAQENIKIMKSSSVVPGRGTVLATGAISGDGVTVQQNNNFLFGSVNITFTETSTGA